MAFTVLYSPEAVDHLSALSKAEQVRVVEEVEVQLTEEPMQSTRKRKLLRPNPIAPWQLSLGDLRVFYDAVKEPEPTVHIKAVGKKVHNVLWIGGERIEL